MKNVVSASMTTGATGNSRSAWFMALTALGVATISACSTSTGASPDDSAPSVALSQPIEPPAANDLEPGTDLVPGTDRESGTDPALGTDPELGGQREGESIEGDLYGFSVEERACMEKYVDDIESPLGVDELEMFMNAYGTLQQQIIDCGDLPAVYTQCAAMAIMEGFEPINLSLAEGLSDEFRTNAADLLDWYLARAADLSAAEPEIEKALSDLRGMSADLATLGKEGSDDEVVADAAIARAQPEIMDQLILMTDRCAEYS